MDSIVGPIEIIDIYDCGRRKPLFAFDIPIVEYALFNIKRFARILTKKGMKMFEMVIGVRRRTIKWIRGGGGRLRSVEWTDIRRRKA